jgi:hypothetical protein
MCTERCHKNNNMKQFFTIKGLFRSGILAGKHVAHCARHCPHGSLEGSVVATGVVTVEEEEKYE